MKEAAAWAIGYIAQHTAGEGGKTKADHLRGPCVPASYRIHPSLIPRSADSTTAMHMAHTASRRSIIAADDSPTIPHTNVRWSRKRMVPVQYSLCFHAKESDHLFMQLECSYPFSVGMSYVESPQSIPPGSRHILQEKRIRQRLFSLRRVGAPPPPGYPNHEVAEQSDRHNRVKNGVPWP